MSTQEEKSGAAQPAPDQDTRENTEVNNGQKSNECATERKGTNNGTHLHLDSAKASKLPVLQRIRGLARQDTHAERKNGKPHTVRRDISDKALEYHLASLPVLDVYLVRPGSSVTQCAVLDFDNHQDPVTGELLAWETVAGHARRVLLAARAHGLRALPVRSGGGMGIHLWFWWDTPQEARSVRALLAEVLADTGLKPGADGVANGQVEIFPKQDSVPLGGCGNCCALPFAPESAPLDECMAIVDAPGDWPCSEPVPFVPPRSQKQARANGLKPSTEIIRSALAVLESDDRDTWIEFGYALKHEYGDEGFALWDEWSSRSNKYDVDDCAQTWDSLNPNGSKTVASIFHAARKSGWVATRDDFECGGKGGNPTHNPGNIRLALSKLIVTVSYDVFQDRMFIHGLADFGPTLIDAAMNRLRMLVEEEFGFLPPKELFFDVVEDHARRNSFHPVNDYLDGLKWDGVPRIDGWLTTYGGAEDTAYARAVGALMLVAAVRRVRKPGCKFDEMLVLESAQGLGKSTALKVLAVYEDWFSDDMPLDAKGKEVIERLKGRWIVECAELNGMNKTKVEHVKSFLSRSIDRARMAYGRLTLEAPRQCVLFGTTNNKKYLRDTSGARRFWPCEIREFDLTALRRDVHQLWAEASAREASGVSIRLDPALYPDAAAAQQGRSVEDPIYEHLENALGTADDEGCLKGKLLAEDVWTTILGVPVEKRAALSNSMGEAMARLGFKRDRLRFGGSGPQYCYLRGTKEEQAHRIEPDELRRRVQM